MIIVYRTKYNIILLYRHQSNDKIKEKTINNIQQRSLHIEAIVT
jgi:hypothetical protein